MKTISIFSVNVNRITTAGLKDRSNIFFFSSAKEMERVKTKNIEEDSDYFAVIVCLFISNILKNSIRANCDAIHFNGTYSWYWEMGKNINYSESKNGREIFKEHKLYDFVSFSHDSVANVVPHLLPKKCLLSKNAKCEIETKLYPFPFSVYVLICIINMCRSVHGSVRLRCMHESHECILLLLCENIMESSK